MNINFQGLIPQDFNNNSRVWVYQSNRAFTVNEALEIEKLLQSFVSQWNSHGDAVKGYANLFFGQFIIFMVDESNSKIGGCSTDSSVRFVKNIEQDYGVHLFDRQMLAFIIDERIQLLPLAKVNSSIESDVIESGTLYFNNTILTKSELLSHWIIPLKNSWLSGRIPATHLH